MPPVSVKTTCSFTVALVSLLAFTACSHGGGSMATPATGIIPALAPQAQTQAAAQAQMQVQSVAVAAAASGVSPAITAPDGFAGVRATFDHSLISENGILVANYAKHYGLRTIFVHVTSDDIRNLLAHNKTTDQNLEAMIDVANVYFVVGSPTWLSTPSTLPADAASLVKVAGMHRSAAGVLYAVDPERLASWSVTQRQALMTSYFTLVHTLLAQPLASNFKETFFVADGDWSSFHYGTPTGPTMLAQLQSQAGVSGIDLLAPGTSAAAQMSGIASALKQLTKPFWVESSTSPLGPRSYSGVTEAALRTEMLQLGRNVAAQNGNYVGTLVNGWNDSYTSLQTILPPPASFNGTLASGKLVPPSGKMYVGANVNPADNRTGNTPVQTSAFEAQIGRKLAFNVHFHGFMQTFPGVNESDDIANGRIPFVAWNCGFSNASIAAGAHDTSLINHARAIKQFGRTVFLRWFWEMNLDDTSNGRTQCYDPATDLPNGYFSPEQFIAAWRHVHAVFATEGVTNVVWVWCVSHAGGGGAQYYPGDDVVDWVAMDAYNNQDVSMQSTFFIMTEQLAQFQAKPLMVAETGAHDVVQPAFLDGSAAVLQQQFPQVRAVGYFDAAGLQNWILTPAGMSSFKTFSNAAYASAMPVNP